MILLFFSQFIRCKFLDYYHNLNSKNLLSIDFPYQFYELYINFSLQEYFRLKEHHHQRINLIKKDFIIIQALCLLGVLIHIPSISLHLRVHEYILLRYFSLIFGF